MGIDLSTNQEVELRFAQLVAYFAIQVRDEAEPKDVYLELFEIAKALKDKYAQLYQTLSENKGAIMANRIQATDIAKPIRIHVFDTLSLRTA